MAERSAPKLATIMAASTAALTLTGLTILALTLDHPPEGGWGFRGFPTIFAATAGPVGWLVMVRRPDNRIGIVLSAFALLAAVQLLLTEFSAAGMRESLPGSSLAAWVNAWIWVPGATLAIGVLPLLFPDGRLLSRRWRPVAWLMTVSAALAITVIAVYPGALDTPRPAVSPISLPISDGDLNTLSYGFITLLGVSVLGAAASVLVRWRRSSGVVHEQLKWLALSVALVVSTMWLSLVPGLMTSAVFIAAVATVPIAVGIAVLRYRLYEIDAVINRTLVFGALTAILTGGFAALQKVLQEVFVAVTGNESDAATIITTLVLATSFVPIKKALEKVVERRLARGVLPAGKAADAPVAESAGEGSAVGTAVRLDPELEPLLRRVVREELRAALDGLPKATTQAD